MQPVDWRDVCAGAAIGPFLASAIPNWTHLFYLLMACVGAAGLVCHLVHMNAILLTLSTVPGPNQRQGGQGNGAPARNVRLLCDLHAVPYTAAAPNRLTRPARYSSRPRPSPRRK